MQEDTIDSKTIKTAEQYAQALLKKDQQKLDEMTHNIGGAIGASKNNITSFNQTGVSKISTIMGEGRKAAVLFEDQQGPKCIGLFTVTGEGKVQSDWGIFQKI